jgi:hypothetical protein
VEPSTAIALGSFAAIVSASVATLTVIISFNAILQAKRTQELAIADRVYNSIAELEEKLYNAVAAKQGNDFLPSWRGLFLNRLEYFSFLVNQNYLQDKKLTSFFMAAIVRWYEDIFDKLADQTERTDPTVYPELKVLYAKLKA